ncbi:NADP-dependent oxidoreductase [Streptomyces tsukubensis]|uniref:Alcohol dehydrogenase n=1 Tax=Streptomyces tsukubensis TaxID=83656 RepID=A0A1V4AE76_9ACTN|nr:NADP-dependent oxidoreductase [Streptomyces tsukubensis]OON82320.1 alcohol dehydrogenase [Streptomyces tsukubensis]QFR92812.1 zinc-binding dehydrogenase [Streptomyces tsukubensis]
MKAISYRRYGGPEVLEYGELPDPKVAPDAVLVKVRAASVNPVDWKCQEGSLDPMLDAVFPVIPGWDVAGVVVQLGASVDEYAVGDEVMGYVRKDILGPGTFAEYVAAPVRTLARKPRNLGFEEASTLPLAGLTAYQALVRWLGVGPGETVLVHGGAGAVGSFALAVARHLGARPIGAARASALDRIRVPGALTVAYGDGFAERVREIAPDGVDAVFDTVGGDLLRTTPELLAEDGRVASIADGEVQELGGDYVFVRPETAGLAALAQLAEDGEIRAEVAGTFPLERAADAQRFAREGGKGGKAVVTVDWPEGSEGPEGEG